VPLGRSAGLPRGPEIRGRLDEAGGGDLGCCRRRRRRERTGTGRRAYLLDRGDAINRDAPYGLGRAPGDGGGEAPGGGGDAGSHSLDGLRGARA